MRTNGQPPNMLASQNATTTETMIVWMAMGTGWEIAPPRVYQCANATTAATAAVKPR
jgi:hypothetical protein